MVEDFESRPRKAVTFWVDREVKSGSARVQEGAKSFVRIQWWNMPGRSNAEGEKEEKAEEEEVRRVEKEVMNAVLMASPIESTASGVVVVVEDMENVGRGPSGVVAEELFQHVNQSWDCSQVEKEQERCDGLAHG